MNKHEHNSTNVFVVAAVVVEDLPTNNNNNNNNETNTKTKMYVMFLWMEWWEYDDDDDNREDDGGGDGAVATTRRARGKAESGRAKTDYEYIRWWCDVLVVGDDDDDHDWCLCWTDQCSFSARPVLNKSPIFGKRKESDRMCST